MEKEKKRVKSLLKIIIGFLNRKSILFVKGMTPVEELSYEELSGKRNQLVIV